MDLLSRIQKSADSTSIWPSCPLPFPGPESGHHCFLGHSLLIYLCSNLPSTEGIFLKYTSKGVTSLNQTFMNKWFTRQILSGHLSWASCCAGLCRVHGGQSTTVLLQLTVRGGRNATWGNKLNYKSCWVLNQNKSKRRVLLKKKNKGQTYFRLGQGRPLRVGGKRQLSKKLWLEGQESISGREKSLG